MAVEKPEIHAIFSEAIAQPVEKPEIHAIFSEAIAQPSEEDRVRYLDQACCDDLQARARVEALLRAHSEAGGFFGGKSPAAVSKTLDMPANPPIAAGVIGPYKLLQQIGEGGMGTVYMAEQTAPVQRRVALKLIKAGMDSRQVIARFEAERQALALMDHPHIAKVLDAGTTDSGLPYFVMELVKGVPITKYCDEHHLIPRQRLELFIPVCQAVQHAHQKGIIHRDLKPSNILVALYDGQPVAKVIDFGVAKATGQKLTERTMYTEFGVIVGTLEYMSPEQAEPNQLDIDTRSDIYSLGVLLYELLTGTTPFEKKRLKDAALMEVLRIIREDEPQKPSTRLSTTDELPSISANRGLEPKKLSDQVRGELDWIVMKALEKDRNRRYETASGFALDIQRYLADEPVLACPASAVYRLRKFARRNKGALTIGSTVALAFLVVVGSLGWMLRDRTAREEQFASQRAAREQEFAREGEAREAALNREVDRALGEADHLGEQEKWPEAHDAAERAEKLLASAGRSDRHPHLVALQKDLTMAQRLEDIYRNPQRNSVRGAPSDTIELVAEDLDHDPQRGSTIAPVTAPMPVLGGMPGRLLPAEDSAEEEIFAGREQDARFAAAFQEFGIDVDALEIAEAAARIGRTTIRAALVKALDDWAAMRRRARGENDAGWKKLVQIARLADRDEWRNRFRGALLARDRQALKTLADDVSPRDAPPATLLLLADTLKQLGELEQGMSVLAQAQRQYSDDVWLNDALASMSESACKPPRYADALRFYTVASALRPRSPRWHMALALVHHQTQSFDQALAERSRVIELQPDNAAAWNSRAGCYWHLTKWDKAAADYSKVIELKPNDANAWGSRAYCWSALQQPVKALADYAKAIELDSKTIELKPDDAAAWKSRANCYANLRQWDKAAADYSKVIELWPDDGHAWYQRGVCYRNLEQQDKALAADAKAIELYSKAIELRPYDAQVWSSRAACYSSLGQWDKAAADYSKIIELKLDDVNAWFRRANCYERLKQWDNAAADYSKIIERTPDDARAWSKRGWCYWNLQQWDKVGADFSKAVELRPDDAGHWFSRAWYYYLFLRQWDKAIADYSKAIELKPDYTGAWQNRGECYSHLQQWDKALADYAKAFELDPGNVYPQIRRATIYEQRKEWDKAAAAYSKVIELRPDDARTWQGRGRCYSALQRSDEAAADFSKVIELCSRAIELTPDDAAAWNSRADFYWSLHQWDKAVADYSRAIELKPDDANAWQGRGLTHQSRMELDKALSDFAKAVELDPKSAERHNNIAWLLVTWPDPNLRHPATGLALATKAVELAPEEGTFRNTLGVAQYRAGDWKAAVEALNKSIELRMGGDAFDWFFLAMAHWREGSHDEARRWYDKATAWRLQNAQDNEELERFDAEAKEVLGATKS